MENNDLISRSALKEEIVNSDYLSSDEKSLFLSRIDNAPTVEDSYNKGYSDAVQGIADEMVRRNQHIEDNRQKGEWVKKYKGQVNSFCSKCDYEVGKKTNFCPDCGAKMISESEDK